MWFHNCRKITFLNQLATCLLIQFSMCLALGGKKRDHVREQKRCPLYRTSEKPQCENMATPPPFPCFLHEKGLLMPQWQHERPHEGGSWGYIELSAERFGMLSYIWDGRGSQWSWESSALRTPQPLFRCCWQCWPTVAHIVVWYHQRYPREYCLASSCKAISGVPARSVIDCQHCLPKVRAFGNPAVLQTLKIMVCLTHRLREAFRSFLEDRQDDASIANLTGTLSPDLLLKDVVSIWKIAVRTSKLHSPTYIQERPT